MLIIKRQTNQFFNIGDGIQVHILDVRGRSVKLGIVAPGELKVLRSELTADKKHERRVSDDRHIRP